MNSPLAEPIKRMMASALDFPPLTATDRRNITDLIARVDTVKPAPDCVGARDSYVDTLTALLAQVRDIVAARRCQIA